MTSILPRAALGCLLALAGAARPAAAETAAQARERAQLVDMSRMECEWRARLGVSELDPQHKWGESVARDQYWSLYAGCASYTAHLADLVVDGLHAGSFTGDMVDACIAALKARGARVAVNEPYIMAQLYSCLIGR